MNKLALIDADGLIYHALRDSLQESLSVIDEKILNIFEKTEATHYVLFISQGKYFRHNLYPKYKLSREKYKNNPSSKWVKVLKQYLIANWNAQWMDNVEADDLVAYWSNIDLIYGKIYTNSEEKGITWRNSAYNQDLEEIEKIICSPDKDLLALKGKHFNYSYKLVDKDKPESVIKGYWITTNTDVADLDFWYSMICGDQADGVKGIEGKGQAYADKIFSNTSTTEWFSTITLRAYVEKYGKSQGIYEFQKNYRLLHMLDCDEDFIREVGKLPQFPEIQSVNKQSVEQQIIPEF